MRRLDSPGVRDLTVVTVTYQSAHVIGGWLDSVGEHLPAAEVVVVDNGSSDATVEIVLEHAVNARVIRQGNLGFARGCNAGARAASRRYLWFLNPDARVLAVNEALLGAELGDTPTGVCETLMARPPGEPVHELYRSRGHAGEWAAHVLTPLWPRALGPAPWSVRRSPGEGWASGASVVMEASEFAHLGGFDESYFLLYEDRELSRRAVTSGLPVRGIESLLVTHDQGTASAGENLDVRRRAWAVLSWLEYVAATEGAPTAEKTARRLVAALERSAALGRLIAPTRTKLARRLGSAAEVLGFARDFVASNPEFYTRARVAIGCVGK